MSMKLPLVLANMTFLCRYECFSQFSKNTFVYGSPPHPHGVGLAKMTSLQIQTFHSIPNKKNCLTEFPIHPDEGWVFGKYEFSVQVQTINSI